MADKSKNQSKCSTKEGQECFVCMDGSCKRPDCKASGETKTYALTVASLPLLSSINEKIDKINRINNHMNFSLSKIRGEYRRDIGEKCCDCVEGNTDAKAFEKHSGWIGAQIDATLAPLGVALTSPPIHIGPGFYVSGKFEVGSLLIDSSVSVSGEISWEESECGTNKGCVEARAEFSGVLSAGPKIKYEGVLDACEAPMVECNNLATISSEVRVGVQTSLIGYVKTYVGDGCQKGCGSISFGSGAGVARFAAELLIFDRYRYSYKVEKTIELWNGTQEGGCS